MISMKVDSSASHGGQAESRCVFGGMIWTSIAKIMCVVSTQGAGARLNQPGSVHSAWQGRDKAVSSEETEFQTR